MNASDKGNQAIREQWQILGFFYDIKDDEKLWYIVGSKHGLINFYNILIDYVNDPQYDKISAHEHYGPYMYLKIMTWDQPNINKNGIRGSKEDLRKLSEIFKTKLKNTSIGHHFTIGSEYTVDNDYSVLVEVMEDSFDPALIDPQLEKDK